MGCGNTLNEVLSRDLLVNNLPKSCVHDFFKVGLSPSKKKLFVFLSIYFILILFRLDFLDI